MSIVPIITFKAGTCDFDEDADVPTVKPQSTPGYIYLHSEDGLTHFCWRPRTASLDEPKLDLLMLPTDGTFTAYRPRHGGNSSTESVTNGRIYVLEFSSSSQKYFFWLQSRSQHATRDPSWFSARDLRLGEIVNTLLQGEEVDVRQAIADLPADGNEGDDGDEMMEDVEGTGNPDEQHQSGSGGAGPGATGGDVRQEGEGSREGGADGGRANAMDARTIIQNFINSMPGSQNAPAAQHREKVFTTLADLLLPQSTIPFMENASEETIDQLLQYLPPALISMAREVDDDTELSTENSIEKAIQALSLGQKKNVLRKVLHSPQFSQSLSSLTVAIRDGGLPIISESLKIPVRNGGYMRRGGVPLGGGDAVEAFLDGVKGVVEKDQSSSKPDGDQMDTQ